MDYAIHVDGNLRTMVSNWGQIGSRPGSPGLGSTEPSLEWPPGSGVEYLWTAGLWIGAFADLESRVTTTSYAIEVRPGAGVEIGRPEKLFTLPVEWSGFTPAPKGDRFLLLEHVGNRSPSLTLVGNWRAQLAPEG